MKGHEGLRKARWGIMERVVFSHDGVIKNGRRERQGISNKILSNNYKSNTSWANVLLSTSVNEAELFE